MKIRKIEIKDFLSSTETLNYNETENIFLTQRQQGKGYVEITFNPDRDGNSIDKPYIVKKNSKNILFRRRHQYS